MNATEYANTVLQARLQQLLNDPRQSQEVKAAIAQLVISAAVPFSLHHTTTGVCKFALGEPVKHLKSGHEYVVVELPINNYLEATQEMCYGYVGVERIVWHRSQEQMEDGRFVSLWQTQLQAIGRFGGDRFGQAHA